MNIDPEILVPLSTLCAGLLAVGTAVGNQVIKSFRTIAAVLPDVAVELRLGREERERMAMKIDGLEKTIEERRLSEATDAMREATAIHKDRAITGRHSAVITEREDPPEAVAEQPHGPRHRLSSMPSR